MSSTRSGYPKAPATEPGWGGASLLLCAHGVRGEVGVAREHAAAIAALDCFATVEACCLHGRPSLEDGLIRTAGGLTYVVPLLMAEGYSLDALSERLAGVRALPSSEIRLCRPVGSHPGLVELILDRAQSQCRSRGWRYRESGLLLIGHGTARHANSSQSLRCHAEALAASRIFAGVSCAFLDQTPDVAEALAALDSPQIVAVGHFADAGPHGADDVAAHLAGRSPQVAYAGPVGCDPGLVSLILDRVRQEEGATLAA